MTDTAADVCCAIVATLKVLGRPEPAPKVRFYSSHTLSLSGRRFVAEEWGEAVRCLRGNGILLDDTDTMTWGPGPNIDHVVTTGWPDDCARKMMKIESEKQARHALIDRLQRSAAEENEP